MDLKSKLRHVMDFPRDGIDFIDITTILGDGELFKQAIEMMNERISNFGEFDIIVAPESRGFIFASPIAYLNGKALVPIRKKGKLPYKTISVEYKLEYGCDIFEMHADAIKPGSRVLIIDDLLATGGTTNSNIELVERLGGKVVGLLCFVELSFLNGRECLKEINVESIIGL